jgi:tetraacyldisaccharide 4'-kinase
VGPLESLYWLGYRLDRRFGLNKAKNLPVKVISIGNLTLGGTGKTPLAIALAQRATKRGIKPCILTRGYKGTLKGPVLVTPDMKPEDAGDEVLLMAKKGLMVIKCPDRYEGGLFALKHLSPAPDLFILDDGYQHWGLKRDTDILLLNGKQPFGNRGLLPLGDLREPIKETKRADIILLTRIKEIPKPVEEEIRLHNPRAPIYAAVYEPAHIADCRGKVYTLNSLKGKEVLAFCGIGEPASFRNTLEETGAIVKELMVFRDHHRFTGAEIRKIKNRAKKQGAEWILTTEKDIIRLGACEGIHAVAVKLSPPEDFYKEALKSG